MSESRVQIGLIWPDADQAPVYRANQFVTQPGPGPDGRTEELVLVMGHVTAPLILGTPDEQAAMLGAMGAVSVKTLGRYSLGRERLRELVALLGGALEAWDRQEGANS